MAVIAFSLLSLLLLSAVGLAMAKIIDQTARDKQRRTYRLAFPPDLDPERVTAWIRSISGILRVKKYQQLFTGMPTIAFELWGTADGISWRLKVPYGYEPAVRKRLEGLIPGIQLIDETEFPVRVWVYAEELKLRAGHRPLSIPNPSDVSTAILGSFGDVAEGQSLMMQWIISPAIPEHKPIHGTANSKENTFWSLLTGSVATSDEIRDRRDKLEEPNLLTVVRVAAVADTPKHASHMVRNVTSSFDATRGPANYFTPRSVSRTVLQRRITEASTPFVFAVQLNAPELTAMIGWPLNNPLVPGMPSPISRRLPTPLSVPQAGIIIGASNYAGHERKIAVGFKEALVHQHVLGPPGQGKTALLANEFKQIVDAGFGAIVIEHKGDLFNQALDYIPTERINDVIVLDVNDVRYPVGFNLLRQGDSAVAIDELISIIKQQFPDNPSMWASEALYHGFHTLARDKKATAVDLLALLMPTSDEVDWADQQRRNVRDPQLKRYWQDIENMSPRDRNSRMEPVASRIWPMSRSKLLNIVGQSESSFSMEEVVRQNKILLVNLSGVEQSAASLMGTLIISVLWQTVKANPMPHSPNYLIMDEAHHFMNLPFDLEIMHVEARSMGLGLIEAHQYLHQLRPDMKQAIMHSTQTKVVFQTSGDDTREMARVLGSPITDHDLGHLAKYEAVARVATPTGISAPLTMNTLEPAKGYGNANQVIYASRGRYGRPVNQVQDEILARRSADQVPRRARGGPVIEGWGNL